MRARKLKIPPPLSHPHTHMGKERKARRKKKWKKALYGYLSLYFFPPTNSFPFFSVPPILLAKAKGCMLFWLFRTLGLGFCGSCVLGFLGKKRSSNEKGGRGREGLSSILGWSVHPREDALKVKKFPLQAKKMREEACKLGWRGRVFPKWVFA